MRDNRADASNWIGRETHRKERLTGEHETAGLMVQQDVEDWECEEDGFPSAMGTFGTLQNARESELFSKIAEAAMTQPSRYERPTLLRKVLFIMGFSAY